MLMRFLLPALLLITLVSCSTISDLIPTRIKSTHNTDGAPSVVKDVSTIRDAQPKPVKRTRAGNTSPYTVLGKTYTLLPESKGYQERGYASWYGTKFHSRNTANGEVYDMWGMTAAHKTLPIPSYVRVTNVDNGLSIVVRVNDRGPFHSERIIDLSYAAAIKLGFAKNGVAQVDVIDVTPVDAGSVKGIPLKPKSQVSVGTISQPSSALGSQAVSLVPVQQPVVPASPAKTQTTVTVTPPVAPTPTYLQVAAFQSIAAANKLQAKLRPLLSVPVKVEPNGKRTWYRVKIGPISNAQMMSESRQILSEQGIQKPIVVEG
ncbi:MAG: rare lipoprotein A [Kiritimatiellia bacterium]|jgi:rare lipoprotein A